MTAKTTKHFDPVFENWKQISTPRIWEVAAMMRGFEPRVMSDVVDANGDALDLSFEIRALISAVSTGLLSSVTPTVSANGQTEVTSETLVPWLRNHGFGKLSDGLTASTPIENGPKRWTPEFTEEVRAYREIHGTKATAEKFEVSGAFIRKKLPGIKAAPKGRSVFNQGLRQP